MTEYELYQRAVVAGSPAYRKAFEHWFRGMPLTKEEQAELDKGRDKSGAYAVPISMDPTMKGWKR